MWVDLSTNDDLYCNFLWDTTLVPNLFCRKICKGWKISIYFHFENKYFTELSSTVIIVQNNLFMML